ncbi:DUF3383 domain-containing protein [Yersinia sp. 2545 StPb PI]|uniref:DUF3383 domain-containing protein n=1 Tax=Yersinia sp. 2545 StPb PI TaxID=3117410 RepID=UPI003FA4CAD9
MTIPAKKIVQVNPGVLSAGGSAVDLNGLILTTNTAIPIGSTLQFSSADAVSKYFGATSTEAEMSGIYFGGYLNATKMPGLLNLTQYPSADVSAYLRSGSLAAMKLDELKLLTGSLTISVDGTPVTAASISLAAATSFSSAATILATALSLPVTFDSIQSAFTIKSTTSGAASTIGYATGTLSAGLKLTNATSAVTSQGADQTNPVEFMTNLVLRTQNFGAFTTAFEPELESKLAFSQWTNSTNKRYAYIGFDTDANAIVADSTNTWAYAVKQAEYEGSCMVYGDLTHAAFVLGVTAAIDFTRTNGRITYAFKRQGGLLPSTTDETEATNLIANGYNFYGRYATSSDEWNFFYPGSVSGSFKWMDAYVNQIQLNASLQSAMLNLLLSVGSIPYNNPGYALVETACLDPLNAAINFGAIRTGTTLSETQIAQIQFAIGSDVSQAIIAKGYYLQIVPATAQIRSARTSPSMTLYYADGGAIQKLTLASIEIQ